jgi:hypothetical protein
MKRRITITSKESLLDAIIELVVTAICIGIGVLVAWLFGVDLNDESIDFDLIILLGVAVVIAIILTVYFIRKLIVKISDKKYENKK